MSCPGARYVALSTGVVLIGSRSDPPGDFDTGRYVLCLTVDDPDRHHAHAVAAGAEIAIGPTDQEYGFREYAALDPEGNVWCFGTYQPVAPTPTAQAQPVGTT